MVASTTWSPPTALDSVTSLTTVNGKEWVRTPNFHLIPKSDLPINPLAHTTASYEQDLWDGWTKVDKSDGSVTVVYPPLYSQDARGIKDKHDSLYDASGVEDEIPGLKNAALIEALNRASASKGNLLVSAKEASRTSDLILGTAKRVYSAYRAFRRGDLKEVANQLYLTPKTAHKRWLEYKYGWMPLCQEAKGAAEFFAQQAMGRPPRTVVTGKVGGEYEFHRQIPDTIAGGANWTADEYLQVSYVVRVRIHVELDSPHVSAMQQMGLTNPALFAWEVIPFSFVFDWFCSVGDYLNALTALHGLTVRKSMCDVVDVSRFSHTIPPVTNHDDGSFVHQIGGRHYTVKRRNYVRESINVHSTTLYPTTQAPKSFEKLVTGLALLRASGRRVSGGRI